VLRLPTLLIALAACAGDAPSREQRVIDALADDNYVVARRDRALLAMKLRKLQRGPYEWLRGTAALYWRDVMEPGGARLVTELGDPRSSRVLLLGDPHAENVGTFRAADGTQLIDWNDFDATGYGPYTVDVRRLAASFVVIAGLGVPGDDALAHALAHRVGAAYAEAIAALAAGTAIPPIGLGAHPLFDDELDKARERGDRRFAVDELAPVTGGVRVPAFGDLEPVADDGLLEDRLVPVDAETSATLARAIARWRVGRLTAEAATVKLVARRIGSGVASYAAFRYNAVLEGATPDPADDRVIELKEVREGVIVRGVVQRDAAEWPSPGARAVDTQRRLQVRGDADVLLGDALVGGLALKIRDREAYQRGVDAAELAELAAEDRQSLLDLAAIYGRMLARAHGNARTADGVRGVEVIAPVLATRAAAFADEIAAHARADAAQIVADHAAFADRDLAALVAPEGLP